MDEVQILFANFQILGPLGCQGWVIIPQNVKKVKITAPYIADRALAQLAAVTEEERGGLYWPGPQQLPVHTPQITIEVYISDWIHKFQNKTGLDAKANLELYKSKRVCSAETVYICY